MGQKIKEGVSMTWMVYSGVSFNLGIKWFKLCLSLLTLFDT